jgi:hypothetical protein
LSKDLGKFFDRFKATIATSDLAWDDLHVLSLFLALKRSMAFGHQFRLIPRMSLPGIKPNQ